MGEGKVVDIRSRGGGVMCGVWCPGRERVIV